MRNQNLEIFSSKHAGSNPKTLPIRVKVKNLGLQKIVEKISYLTSYKLRVKATWRLTWRKSNLANRFLLGEPSFTWRTPSVIWRTKFYLANAIGNLAKPNWISRTQIRVRELDFQKKFQNYEKIANEY